MPPRRSPRSASVVPAPNRVLRPATRTVTPPRPATLASPVSRSRTSAVWLSTPEHERAVGEHRLEGPQPALAHVAEAGVVGAALGVVVVGHDGGSQPGRRTQQVEPLEPGRIVTDLVDLVHRDRDDAERERGGARHRQDPAARELLPERVGDARPRPLPERVAGAARPGHHVAGLADPGDRGGGGHGVLGGGPERGDLDRVADARREELERARRQLVRVLLEPVRRVDDGRGHGPRREPVEQRPVDLGHGGRRLARAHHGEHAGAAHARNPSATWSSITSASSTGCWAWTS